MCHINNKRETDYNATWFVQRCEWMRRGCGSRMHLSSPISEFPAVNVEVCRCLALWRCSYLLQALPLLLNVPAVLIFSSRTLSFQTTGRSTTTGLLNDEVLLFVRIYETLTRLTSDEVHECKADS